MPFSATLPVLVIVPENVMAVPEAGLTHCFVTTIAGAVTIRQVALAFALTVPLLKASTPLAVTVSVLSPLVWLGM